MRKVVLYLVIVLCISDIFTLTIDAPGVYDIGLPITGCECMFVDYWYGLSYHFVTEFPNSMNPGILTDDFPVGCTSWDFWQGQWFDLVYDFGFPGEIIMWADAICCEPPVANEDKTWGGMKHLYK